jgi:predicted dehydrogenase
MTKHGIGVIGFGVWGCHSLERELAATGRAEIKALAFGDGFGANCYGAELEIKAREFAADSGAEIAGDWRGLIRREDIDIISAMACPKVKADIIAEALSNGKHVITDKPLALDPGGAERIAAAAGNSTAKLFMLAGYQGRPGVARVIELVKSGAPGDLKALSIRLNFMGGIFSGFTPSKRWRSEVPSGEMTTIGSHAVITAMKIIGRPPKRVYAAMKNDFYSEYAAVGAEDCAVMNLLFEPDIAVNISVGRIPHRIPGEDIIIEATGSKGYVRLNGASLEIWPGGAREEIPANPAKILRDTMSAFLDAAEGKGAVPVSVAEGLALQRVLSAAIQSAKTGSVRNITSAVTPVS